MKRQTHDRPILQKRSTGGHAALRLLPAIATLMMAPVEGGINVVKSGAGMLIISGTNTSSGATSVSVAAGALGLAHTAVLSTNTTVYITSGAVVDLSAGKHVIRNLYVNGLKQRKTLLNATNLPGFLSGTGSFFPTAGWSGTLIELL